MAVTREANIRAEKDVVRRIDLVAPTLLSAFRNLVSGRARWPLFLYGRAGTGKTAAALSLCDHVENSYYRTLHRLADDRMAGGDDIKEVSKKRLAVLDEIGARQSAGDLVYSVTKDFIDRREPHNHVAIYVSNLNIEEIAVLFDDRIASRLSCGTVFSLDGDDRRQR